MEARVQNFGATVATDVSLRRSLVVRWPSVPWGLWQGPPVSGTAPCQSGRCRACSVRSLPVPHHSAELGVVPPTDRACCRCRRTELPAPPCYCVGARERRGGAAPLGPDRQPGIRPVWQRRYGDAGGRWKSLRYPYSTPSGITSSAAVQDGYTFLERFGAIPNGEAEKPMRVKHTPSTVSLFEVG